jgi:hypothetical protein
MLRLLRRLLLLLLLPRMLL